MSTTRSVAKYGIASVVTGFFGLALYAAKNSPKKPLSDEDFRSGVISAAAMTGIVWTLAAL